MDVPKLFDTIENNKIIYNVLDIFMLYMYLFYNPFLMESGNVVCVSHEMLQKLKVTKVSNLHHVREEHTNEYSCVLHTQSF